MSIVSFLRRLMRKLSPPGNRPSLDESGEQSPAPTGLEPPSHWR